MKKKDKLSLNKKKAEINKIRKKIDNIDLKILKQLQLRRKEVLKIVKFKNKKEIVDKKRIKEIINNLTKKGNKLKIEAFIIKKIWMAMIESFIRLEKNKI